METKKFDEWLESREQTYKGANKIYLKIMASENIFYLYDCRELQNNFNYIGIYDKKNKIVYSSIYNLESITNYTVYRINAYLDNLQEDIKNNIMNYINKNKEELKTKAKEIFDYYLTTDYVMKDFENEAQKAYASNKEVKQVELTNQSLLNKAINYSKNSLLFEAIENETKAKEKIYNIYMSEQEIDVAYDYNQNKYITCNMYEYIGFYLLYNEKQQEVYNEYLQNHSELDEVRHNIVNATKNMEAKTFKITILKNDEKITFTVEKDIINFYCKGIWHNSIKEIPIRDKIKNLYGYEDVPYTDILSINYKNKIIYEKNAQKAVA